MSSKAMRFDEGYIRSLVTEAPIPVQDRSLMRSYDLKEKAQRLIPSCAQTFSKSPKQFVQGVAPVFLERGQGCHVWDVDGNEYIDYVMGLGPVILGYDHSTVTEAVIEQIKKGTTFSLPHPLEYQVAERLCQAIPCAEMVRFGKNGSDVTSGAVRAARAYTSRDIILCCGYHGWQDWYIGSTTRDRGVPKAVASLTWSFTYNDLGSLERLFDIYRGEVAAVIMEAVGVVEPDVGFLEGVRDMAHKNGALLIFDEIVTGFRLAEAGAQEYFSVTPDLACFGKAMANGYPLSAVVGRRDVMELFDEIFFSFTFGGETVALAACLATIDVFQTQDVLPHIWQQGQRLKGGYNALAKEYELEAYTDCIGLPPRTIMRFHDETGTDSLLYKSLFQQECLKRGILTIGGHNPTFSHSDSDVDRTLRVYRAALETLASAIKHDRVEILLEGPLIQPVFRRP